MQTKPSSSNEADLFRYIIIDHRARQFRFVVTMSKIDAVLYDERQLQNGNRCRCYLETDVINLFPATHPLNLRI